MYHGAASRQDRMGSSPHVMTLPCCNLVGPITQQRRQAMRLAAGGSTTIRRSNCILSHRGIVGKSRTR